MNSLLTDSIAARKSQAKSLSSPPDVLTKYGLIPCFSTSLVQLQNRGKT